MEKGGWTESFAKYIATRIVHFVFKVARDFSISEFDPQKPYLFADSCVVKCNMDEVCNNLVVAQEDCIDKCSQRIVDDRVLAMTTKLRCSTYVPITIGDGISIDVDQAFLIFVRPFFGF